MHHLRFLKYYYNLAAFDILDREVVVTKLTILEFTALSHRGLYICDCQKR